jgi:hypothetical protein
MDCIFRIGYYLAAAPLYLRRSSAWPVCHDLPSGYAANSQAR